MSQDAIEYLKAFEADRTPLGVRDEITTLYVRIAELEAERDAALIEARELRLRVQRITENAMDLRSQLDTAQLKFAGTQHGERYFNMDRLIWSQTCDKLAEVEKERDALRFQIARLGARFNE